MMTPFSSAAIERPNKARSVRTSKPATDPILNIGGTPRYTILSHHGQEQICSGANGRSMRGSEIVEESRARFQFGAEIRMRDRDHFANPLAQRLALQGRDSVLARYV